MNKEDRGISRRSFMARGLMLGAVAGATGAILAGCGGGSDLTCTDTSGLTPQELATRQSLEYSDHSPFPDKRCSACRFYQPSAEQSQCGRCQLVKGPIHPDGYCKSYVAR
jgi:hypothetical protein